MPESKPVDQDFNLWVLLSQVQTLTLNARETELMEDGTTAMQAAVLVIINAIGDATTPAQISRWLVRQPATISGLLDRMEKAGLAERVKDMPRRNWVRVKITKKGQQVYKQSLKRKSIHQIMGCLSDEEHKQLTSTLVKLRTKASKVLNYKQKITFP
jgi:DNA-binding MarR family transcriptional regulator